MRRARTSAPLAAFCLLLAGPAARAASPSREAFADVRAAIRAALPPQAAGAVTIARAGAGQMSRCIAPLSVSFMGRGEYETAEVACSAPYWTLYVGVAIRAEETVLVATRAIGMGQPIRPGDFRAVRLPADDIGGEPITAQDTMAMTAASPIAPGQTITRTNVVIPLAVHNGEVVTVQVIEAGVAVLARGIALQSGGVGQTILVGNGSSQKRITALIVAPGEPLASGQPFIVAP